jgi:tRNA dimethylallyltransferase
LRSAVILIAGPTASGKSAVALDLAERLGGVIVNADSMQVYRELRIVTARPSAADETRAPHRLYGILPADDPCSVGRWLQWAHKEIEAALETGRVPIVVGGTGMYLSALTEGLAEIPEVPAAVRAAVQQRLARTGTAALHAELARRDPQMAERLRPTDPQRVARALEVLEATGRSLRDWQAAPKQGGLQRPWYGVLLAPPRQLLYGRCDSRLRAMLEQGALDEVAGLLQRNLDPALPAMRALGVPHLIRHLRGECSREEALTAAQTATRRYAKRQMTWFRHKMLSWHSFHAQDLECFVDQIFPFVSEFLLTRTD